MSKTSNQTSLKSTKTTTSWLQRMVKPVRDLSRSGSTNKRKEWNPENFIWKNEVRGGQAPRPKSYKNLMK